MTNMKPYLICVDLDGTLLNNKKELTEVTKHVLLQVMEQGHVVVPVTGRPWAGLPVALTSLAGISYAITSNGATVLDLKKKKVLRRSQMTAEEARRVLKACGWKEQNKSAILEVFVGGMGYLESEDYEALFAKYPMDHVHAYFQQSRKRIEDLEQVLVGDKVMVEEISVSAHRIEEKERIEKQLEDYDFLHVLSSAQRDMEIISSQVDKGRALLWLAKELNIPKERTISFGDSENDLSMLSATEISYAMENGTELVKKTATNRAPSNEEDGVARVLKKIVAI